MKSNQLLVQDVRHKHRCRPVALNPFHRLQQLKKKNDVLNPHGDVEFHKS